MWCRFVFPGDGSVTNQRCYTLYTVQVWNALVASAYVEMSESGCVFTVCAFKVWPVLLFPRFIHCITLPHLFWLIKNKKTLISKVLLLLSLNKGFFERCYFLC